MRNPFCLTIFSSLYPKRLFIFLIALWILTLAGIQSVPLETHESFVLATAQEMNSSGDYLIPHYNGELRLNKPPLNYWVTLLVSAIDPVNSDIQIFHGRAVSLLAVLVMVLLTAHAGIALYGRETGILAALMLMGSNSLLNLSHNAKPDVLYAALCILQLFAWVDAWRADKAVRQTSGALLGWVAAGLATLTKGPQVPAVFLMGFIAFLVCGPDRRRVFRILRPFSGAVVFCFLVLPWWCLLQQKLLTIGASISDSQLSGSLLHNLASWRELLSFYYVWVPVAQMLPASLLLVMLIPRLEEIKKAVMCPPTRLLVYVSITMLILFTFGGHYRKHYTLPLLPVFSILLANSVRFVQFQGFGESWKKFLVSAAVAGALLCAGFMVWAGAYVTVALFLAVSVLIARALMQEMTDSFRESPLFAKQLMVIATVLVVLGAGFNAYRPSLQWPMRQQEFKRRVGAMLAEDDQLICWRTSVNVLPYFAKRQVIAFKEADALERYVMANRRRHALFAILPTCEMLSINEHFSTRLKCSVADKKERENVSVREKGLSCVEILGLREPPVK